MKYLVGEVECVDDGQTMGVCASTGDGIVTLIFNRATDHKQMDELAAQLRKLGLSEIVIDPDCLKTPVMRDIPTTDPNLGWMK
jgi:hypothetical protein